MGIIQFREANCKNCYKCIRNCAVKSIRFANEQARILDNECILCGHCTRICPQKAKTIESDVDEVKALLASKRKVYVSLAPSYVSAFEQADFSRVSAALKKLGFTAVEETAIGAAQVSAQYAALMQKGTMKNIITTCCPTIVMLVEKYYPELLSMLAPVVSPALAHAKMMKNVYGSRIKVVFIGPCISKKHEARQSNFIDNTLLFDELHAWMVEEGIDVDAPDEEASEPKRTISRLYPVPGGIIRTIPSESRRNYKSVAVDGLERCVEVLDSLKSGKLQNFFIEMSACPGSCVGGPGLSDFDTPMLLSNERILGVARRRTHVSSPVSEDVNVDLTANYIDRRIRVDMPSESAIQAVLRSMGKVSPETMLNCGACGYQTCREKAIAVVQGKAEMKMCLPFMREKAESMANRIIDNTPNAIFVLDSELNILEFNAAARKTFGMTDLDYIGLPIEMVLNNGDFSKVKETKEDIIGHRLHLMDSARIVEQTITHIADSGTYLVIARDVTDEEGQMAKMAQMRVETLEVTQKVIDKQMRVAQEIASLLGETTGETKAALTKLKKFMVQESEQ